MPSQTPFPDLQSPPSEREGAEASALRVASWNIQSCRRGLAQVANLLESLRADVVALQEVERDTARSGGVDQAAFLARSAGFEHHVFVPTLRRDGGDYGIALLSRHRIEALPALELPTARGIEPRALGLARVTLGARALLVGFTHLSHRLDLGHVRHRQALRIAERLGGEGACLLLGDFNGLAGSAMHSALSRHFRDVFACVGQGAGGTHRPLGPFFPSLRIDFMFAGANLVPELARVVATRASDHHALLGELRIAVETRPDADKPRAQMG